MGPRQEAGIEFAAHLQVVEHADEHGLVLGSRGEPSGNGVEEPVTLGLGVRAERCRELGDPLRQFRYQAGQLAHLPYQPRRSVMSSTKPINTPDDLRGFKIRVPVSPLWTSMYKAFEAAPTSINFNEVYTALQTKVVDGQENPLAIISTAKLYEVQKYCSMTNHMWDGFWFLANRRAWERLPQDVRTIVAKHINAAGEKEREDVAKLNASLQQDLAAKGMVFNQPDPAPFRDKLRKAGFYAEWKGKYGDEAWAILEKSVGSSA